MSCAFGLAYSARSSSWLTAQGILRNLTFKRAIVSVDFNVWYQSVPCAISEHCSQWFSYSIYISRWMCILPCNQLVDFHLQFYRRVSYVVPGTFSCLCAPIFSSTRMNGLPLVSVLMVIWFTVSFPPVKEIFSVTLHLFTIQWHHVLKLSVYSDEVIFSSLVHYHETPTGLPCSCCNSSSWM